MWTETSDEGKLLRRKTGLKKIIDFSKVYKNRHLEDFKFVWSRGIVFSDLQVHGAGENTFRSASVCDDGTLFG